MRDSCPFCDYEGPSPILARVNDVFIIEPINPVVPGHVLVIPEKHVSDFDADAATSVAVLGTAINYIRSKRIMAYNLITSKSPEATQTVFHLHVHIIPRHWDDGVVLPWTEPEGGS